MQRQLPTDQAVALERGPIAELAIVEMRGAVMQLRPQRPEIGEFDGAVELVAAREVQQIQVLAIVELEAHVTLERVLPRREIAVLDVERGVQNVLPLQIADV